MWGKHETFKWCMWPLGAATCTLSRFVGCIRINLCCRLDLIEGWRYWFQEKWTSDILPGIFHLLLKNNFCLTSLSPCNLCVFHLQHWKLNPSFALAFDTAWDEIWSYVLNLLNTELNPISHLLALLGAHLVFHVSRIGVKISFQIVTRSFLRSRFKKCNNEASCNPVLFPGTFKDIEFLSGNKVITW